MAFNERTIRDLTAAKSRMDLWVGFIRAVGVRRMAEVGVYRGEFAEVLLKTSRDIERYYMIDPWRHLDDWNKPANTTNSIFEGFLIETKQRTEFAVNKRIVLRGKTTEVARGIPDGELDFCYIDGDHTLKGITIDLWRCYPKVKTGGWIGGDDFVRSVWQHGPRYEPTLVFPFAVYFAEAVGAHIYALPHAQFLIHKQVEDDFSFIDLTGKYADVSLINQFNRRRTLREKLIRAVAIGRRFLR
jgi:hypothetical protein